MRTFIYTPTKGLIMNFVDYCIFLAENKLNDNHQPKPGDMNY